MYADRHAIFLTKEADFYVRLPVESLTDEMALGDWIAQIMQTTNDIPVEDIPGPQPGFVEFWFIKSATEQIIVRLPIQQYEIIGKGKTGAELFRWFYIPPISTT